MKNHCIYIVLPIFCLSCYSSRSYKSYKDKPKNDYINAINFCKTQKLDSLLSMYKEAHNKVPCEVKIVNYYVNSDESDSECYNLLTETKGGLSIRQNYKVSPNDSVSFVELNKMYSIIYDKVEKNSEKYFIEISKFYYVLYVKKKIELSMAIIIEL